MNELQVLLIKVDQFIEDEKGLKSRAKSEICSYVYNRLLDLDFDDAPVREYGGRYIIYGKTLRSYICVELSKFNPSPSRLSKVEKKSALLPSKEYFPDVHQPMGSIEYSQNLVTYLHLEDIKGATVGNYCDVKVLYGLDGLEFKVSWKTLAKYWTQSDDNILERWRVCYKYERVSGNVSKFYIHKDYLYRFLSRMIDLRHFESQLKCEHDARTELVLQTMNNNVHEILRKIDQKHDSQELLLIRCMQKLDCHFSSLRNEIVSIRDDRFDALDQFYEWQEYVFHSFENSMKLLNGLFKSVQCNFGLLLLLCENNDLVGADTNEVVKGFLQCMQQVDQKWKTHLCEHQDAMNQMASSARRNRDRELNSPEDSVQELESCDIPPVVDVFDRVIRSHQILYESMGNINDLLSHSGANTNTIESVAPAVQDLLRTVDDELIKIVDALAANQPAQPPKRKFSVRHLFRKRNN